MNKVLILLLLGSFSMQISSMDNNPDNNDLRPTKNQKTVENETKEKEEKNYAEIELAKQKKEFEDVRHFFSASESYLDSSDTTSPRFGKPEPIRKQELQLRFAVENNYIELAKDALHQGAYPNISVGDYPLLIYTLCYYNFEMFNLLLNHPKIDVNALSINSPETATAIFYTTNEPFPEILNSLIKAGADPKHRDSKKNTVLIDLFNQILELDKHNEKDETQSIAEMYIKYIKFSKILVENGVKINIKNNEGNTALMKAVQVNFLPLKVIIVLVDELNAKVDIKNKEGETALDIAKNAYKDACENTNIYSVNPQNAKDIVDFLENTMQKEKSFSQKLIKREILEASPLPEALANLTSQYLEGVGSFVTI